MKGSWKDSPLSRLKSGYGGQDCNFFSGSAGGREPSGKEEGDT